VADGTRPTNVPSLPWTWTGGYPQRITGPDATLIAEVYENPDLAAVIAPLICESVNAHFDLWSETPLALLLGGPSDGKLVPITGPYEEHREDGVLYQVVPRGADDWRFPIRYRYVEAR
jgi:hypothetical protein